MATTQFWIVKDLEMFFWLTGFLDIVICRCSVERWWTIQEQNWNSNNKVEVESWLSRWLCLFVLLNVIFFFHVGPFSSPQQQISSQSIDDWQITDLLKLESFPSTWPATSWSMRSATRRSSRAALTCWGSWSSSTGRPSACWTLCWLPPPRTRRRPVPVAVDPPPPPSPHRTSLTSSPAPSTATWWTPTCSSAAWCCHWSTSATKAEVGVCAVWQRCEGHHTLS